MSNILRPAESPAKEPATGEEKPGYNASCPLQNQPLKPPPRVAQTKLRCISLL